MFAMVSVFHESHHTVTFAALVALYVVVQVLFVLRARTRLARAIVALVLLLAVAVPVWAADKQRPQPEPESIVLVVCSSWDDYVNYYGWLADYFWWLHGC